MRNLGARLEQSRNLCWRTLVAFLPQLVKPDDDYAKAILTKAEYGLYRKMDVRDRAHACAVTKALKTRYPGASGALQRAALLHDVGKVGARYNPLARILVALYTPPEIAAAPRLAGFRGAWQVKRHHDRYGAELIVSAGGCARVAELVGRHHRPGTDPEASRLQEIDARF